MYCNSYFKMIKNINWRHGFSKFIETQLIQKHRLKTWFLWIHWNTAILKTSIDKVIFSKFTKTQLRHKHVLKTWFVWIHWNTATLKRLSTSIEHMISLNSFKHSYFKTIKNINWTHDFSKFIETQLIENDLKNINWRHDFPKFI